MLPRAEGCTLARECSLTYVTVGSLRRPRTGRGSAVERQQRLVLAAGGGLRARGIEVAERGRERAPVPAARRRSVDQRFEPEDLTRRGLGQLRRERAQAPRSGGEPRLGPLEQRAPRSIGVARGARGLGVAQQLALARRALGAGLSRAAAARGNRSPPGERGREPPERERRGEEWPSRAPRSDSARRGRRAFGLRHRRRGLG